MAAARLDPRDLVSSRFTLQIPQDALRLGLAGVLALSGIKLLNVPAASYVIAIGFGVGLTAFVVWLLDGYARRTIAPR